MYPFTKALIFRMSSRTLGNDPRPMAFWVMMEKKRSTWLIYGVQVGVKCKWNLGRRASQLFTLAC